MLDDHENKLVDFKSSKFSSSLSPQQVELQIFCALISNPTVFDMNDDQEFDPDYVMETKALASKLAKLFK